MFAIRAFVGPNGGGKTLAMTQKMALPALRSGRPVVANYRIDHPLWVPLETWRQIPDLRECVLLLDEISSVLPSRQAMSVPPQLVRILNQMRKGDVQLGWSAPNWSRCDVLLREVTQAVTVCTGAFPDRWVREEVAQGGRLRRYFPRALRDDEGKREPWVRGWAPNRLFRFTTYDAQEFDEFTYSAVKDVRAVRRERYWRSAHRAYLLYDTHEAVMLLDHLDDVGTCVNCGGQRKRPSCKCGPAPAGPKARSAEGPPGSVDAGVLVDERDPLGPVAAGAGAGPAWLS